MQRKFSALSLRHLVHQPKPVKRRRRWPMLVVTAVVVILAATIVVLALIDDPSSSPTGVTGLQLLAYRVSRTFAVAMHAVGSVLSGVYDAWLDLFNHGAWSPEVAVSVGLIVVGAAAIYLSRKVQR